MIDFKKFGPTAKLKPFIQSYFVIATGIHCSKGAGFKQFIQEEKDACAFLKNHPQGSIDLMFTLHGEGASMRTTSNEVNNLNNIFIVAQQEGKFEFKFSKDAFFVGVVFHGESFNKLFKLPIHEIANNGVEIDKDLNSTYLELHDKLRHAKTDVEIANLLDAFFIQRFSEVDYSFSKFDYMIQQIRIAHGQINIDGLSRSTNISNRTLQRNMKNILGVSAKSYATIMRFKRVMILLNASPNVNWQDIVFSGGYFDQAHFIKDFKRFTGHTPTSYIEGDPSLSSFFASQQNL